MHVNYQGLIPNKASVCSTSKLHLALFSRTQMTLLLMSEMDALSLQSGNFSARNQGFSVDEVDEVVAAVVVVELSSG